MLFATLVLSSTAKAAPAYPKKIEMTEPATGLRVSGYQVGDEFFSYCTDEQGRLFELDTDGRFRRVVRDGSGYALGGYVTQVSVRSSVAEGADVSRGDAGLREKLTNMRETLHADVPMLLDDGEEEEQPVRSIWGYDHVLEERDAAAGRWRAYSERISEYAPRAETVPLLVLKLNYTNVKCVFDDAAWHKRVFDDGVSSYYTEVSGGRFTYVPAKENAGTANDGVVSVTLPIDCPSYMTNGIVDGAARGIYQGTDGKEYGIINDSLLYAYALVQADSAVNFKQYDTNGDGRIDPTELAITVVQPGMDASVSKYSAYNHAGIWPHSGVIHTSFKSSGQEYMMVCADDVCLYKYTIVAENINPLYQYPGDRLVSGEEDTDDDPFDENESGDTDVETGEGSEESEEDGEPGTEEAQEPTEEMRKPQQAQYGTICHELGHDLGLMDLYDVDQNDVSICGMMSLMSAGGEGARKGEDNGSCPTHLDPYSKIFLGFYDAQELVWDDEVTLYAASDSAHYNILKIPSSEPGVYFLVENRQFTGFDEGLDWAYRYCMNPLRGGLVIWRIDENIINQYWQMNWVNCNPDGRGITVFFTQDDPDVIDEYKELELTPFYKSGMEPLYLEMDTDLAVAFSGEGRLMRAAVTGLGDAPDVLPKTGDRSHLLLWALLLAISVAALAALGWLIRKKVIRSLSM